jgi:HrpA-like RNA helicase
VQKSVEITLKINLSKESGDILIFLTGQEEVDRAVRLLKEHANNIEQANKKEKMFVLPMYGSLPYHEQLKVFKSAPDGYRKVVVATNVAETSITIPGIVHGMRTSCLESLLHAYVSSNRLWFCEDAMVQ